MFNGNGRYAYDVRSYYMRHWNAEVMQISLEKYLVFKRFEKYCIYCVDCSLGTDSFVIILLSLCFVGFCASSGNVNVLLIYLLDGIISLADRHYTIIIILFGI